MQVKKTFKGNKEIIQEGYETPGMAKTNKIQSPMKETKLSKLKMSPKIII